MKTLKLSILPLFLLTIAAYGSNDIQPNEPKETPSITFITTKAIGEEIQIAFEAGVEGREDIFIDLNNNGKKDPGEGIDYFDKFYMTGSDNRTKYQLQNQVVTIYGDVTRLDVSSNHITYLDTSKNPKLQKLICFSNRLDSLNVSKNSELTYINISDNNISEIDLSNQINLAKFACGSTLISNLDLTRCTKIQAIYTNFHYALKCVAVPKGKTTEDIYWERSFTRQPLWDNSGTPRKAAPQS